MELTEDSLPVRPRAVAGSLPQVSGRAADTANAFAVLFGDETAEIASAGAGRTNPRAGAGVAQTTPAAAAADARPAGPSLLIAPAAVDPEPAPKRERETSVNPLLPVLRLSSDGKAGPTPPTDRAAETEAALPLAIHEDGPGAPKVEDPRSPHSVDGTEWRGGTAVIAEDTHHGGSGTLSRPEIARATPRQGIPGATNPPDAETQPNAQKAAAPSASDSADRIVPLSANGTIDPIPAGPRKVHSPPAVAGDILSRGTVAQEPVRISAPDAVQPSESPARTVAPASDADPLPLRAVTVLPAGLHGDGKAPVYRYENPRGMRDANGVTTPLQEDGESSRGAPTADAPVSTDGSEDHGHIPYPSRMRRGSSAEGTVAPKVALPTSASPSGVVESPTPVIAPRAEPLQPLAKAGQPGAPGVLTPPTAEQATKLQEAVRPEVRGPSAVAAANDITPPAPAALKQNDFTSIPGGIFPASKDLSLQPLEQLAALEVHVAKSREGTGPGTLHSAPTGEIARVVVDKLVGAVRASGDGIVDVQLSPEELGRVKLSLTVTDGGMLVAISAERPETLDLMRRHIDFLVREFREQGFTSIHFSFGQGNGHGAFAKQSPDQNTSEPEVSAGHFASEPEPGALERLRGIDSLDLRI